jgi:hypothetical protein
MAGSPLEQRFDAGTGVADDGRREIARLDEGLLR